MWPLLRRISLRDYIGAPGRLALMLGGIAMGVALIAALGIINASVLANFRASLERAAGRAALQVVLGTGEVGFDERVRETVAKDPDVENAFGLVRGTLVRADAPEDVLQLFGVDLGSDAIDAYDVRAADDVDTLVVMNDLRSVLVTGEWARRRGVEVGDTVRFAGPSGIVELHVRGLLRPEGLATVFGGSLAIMDLPAAQRLLGKDGRVDQVDVLLRGHGRAARVAERLARVLPGSLRVERPRFRGERFERVVGAFQAMLDGLSLLCLLAGIFIVYNTTATAVTERARDLAILIAVGADRRAIRRLLLCESALLGVLASVVGVAIGVGLSRVLLGLVSQSMGVIYQTRFTVDRFTLGWEQVAAYVALGTVSAVIAAMVPARKASGLDPLELMRPDFRERLAITAADRVLVGWGVVLLGATWVSVWLEDRTRSVAWGNMAGTLLWLSAVFFAIPLMGAICRLLRVWLPRTLGIEGRMAAESLGRSPGRTGVTAAVIALSLTLAITVSAVATSFRESERDWFILAGDLVVSSVSTEGGWLETPLAGEVEDVLRGVPGVAGVETYRALEGQELGDARIAVVALSRGFLATPQLRRSIVVGDADAAVSAVADGDAVLVSDNLADRLRVGVGDVLDVPTPAGAEAMRIAGVVTADFSGDQGAVLMGRERFAAAWGDRRVSHFNVFLLPGADADAVRDAVARALAGRWLVKILTVPQTLAYHQGMVDRAFVFTWAIQLLVVAVTLAGIFDLLLTQIIERRQELGVFRAIGADAPKVARGVRIEAGVIGFAGAALGAVLAVGTSLIWVRVNFRILIGYVLGFHFPLATATWCIALASGVAVIAGELAARKALRQPVLDALRCE